LQNTQPSNFKKVDQFCNQTRSCHNSNEYLKVIKESLAGLFLGERWRYHELQEFIQYKAKEVGIVIEKVDPQFTS